MRITNKMNLPQPIVDAVKNDGYSSGNADISVTTLLKPARIVALEKKHKDDLEEDASDRIWSLCGQVIHGILEKSDTTGISERRLSIEVNGWKVSGQMDRYVDGELSDYKFVTAYKFSDGGVPIDYEQQLNCYAEILRQNGHPVNRLKIVGILRDWSKMEAFREPNYPQSQVIVRDVPIWHSIAVQEFIQSRIAQHKAAQANIESYPECSPEERWAKPSKYAVIKEGAQRALKLYDNEVDAQSHASTNTQLRVDVRPGQNTRCSYYCSVNKYCTFYQNLKAQEAGKKD